MFLNQSTRSFATRLALLRLFPGAKPGPNSSSWPPSFSSSSTTLTPLGQVHHPAVYPPTVSLTTPLVCASGISQISSLVTAWHAFARAWALPAAVFACLPFVPPSIIYHELVWCADIETKRQISHLLPPLRSSLLMPTRPVVSAFPPRDCSVVEYEVTSCYDVRELFSYLVKLQ